MQDNSDFRQDTLEGGTVLVGQHMTGVESAAIGFLIGTGSRDEAGFPPGVSHFTEQMLFRGTKDLDARALSERLDSLGISYDSSSGVEMSLVSAVMIGTQLQPAVDLLADVVGSPAFPEDDVDSVRRLIQQEIQQREDRPAQLVWDILRRQCFAGSPLASDVLGTPESIAEMNREDLMRYWTERYTANNVVVSVAGNFDWEATRDQVRTIAAQWRQGPGRSVVHEPTPQQGITVIEKEAAQENIGFVFPAVSVADPHYYTAALMSLALGGGSNSRLYREVREKRGLAYAVQSRFDGFEKTGLFRIYVGTSAERAHESVEVVLEEIDKLEANGISDDELRRSKTRLKSQLIMRSESTRARMGSNLRSWWYEGKLYTLDEIRARIDAVTVETVRNFAASLRMREQLSAVGIGPRSQDELFGDVMARA